MSVLVIFFLAYFLKCYYQHLSFSDGKNCDFYIFFHVFLVYFLFYMNEDNLNNKSHHYDLMLFPLIIQICFLLQDNANY